MKTQVKIGLIVSVLIVVAIVFFITSRSSSTHQGNHPDDVENNSTPQQTFRMAVLSQPSSLAPTKLVNVEDGLAVAMVHCPLALVDSEGNLQFLVAEKIELSPDAQSMTIQVRDGLTFWDGSPVTAKDVANSIAGFHTSQHPQNWIVQNVKGISNAEQGIDQVSGLWVSQENPLELIVTFSKPEPNAPELFSTTVLSIVKTSDEEEKPLDLQILGCGPYSVTEIKPGISMELQHNPGSPRITPSERVVIEVVDDESRQLDMYRRGELDLVRVRGPLLAEVFQNTNNLQLKKTLDGSQILRAEANEQVILFVNWESEELAEIPEKQRASIVKSISESIDRSAITNRLYLGLAKPSHAVTPPSVVSVEEPEKTNLVKQEKTLSVSLIAPTDLDSRRIVDFLTASLEKNNLQSTTNLYDLAGIAERLIGKKYTFALAFLENNVGAHDPYPWTIFFRDDSPFVVLGEVVEHASDDAIRIRSITGQVEREKEYNSLIKRITSTQTTWIPLWSREAVYLTTFKNAPQLDINGQLQFGLWGSTKDSEN